MHYITYIYLTLLIETIETIKQCKQSQVRTVFRTFYIWKEGDLMIKHKTIEYYPQILVPKLKDCDSRAC